MEIKKNYNYSFFHALITSILTLILAVVSYLLTLKTLLGDFELSSAIPSQDAYFNMLNIIEKPKAGILYSKYTENFLRPKSSWHKEQVLLWETILRKNGFDSEIIEDDFASEDLFSINRKFQFIVIPGALVLNDRFLIFIKKYINNGGSVFFTNSNGVYSPNGNWRGWNFYEEILGVKFYKEYFEDSITTVRFLSNSPLTAGILPGFPLKIANWDKTIGVEILESRTKIVSVIDYDFSMKSLYEFSKNKTVSLYGTYGKGRYVWIGFSPSSVIGNKVDMKIFEIFLKNSFSYLTSKPVVDKQIFPYPYEAAISFNFLIDSNSVNKYLNAKIDLAFSESINYIFKSSNHKKLNNEAKAYYSFFYTQNKTKKRTDSLSNDKDFNNLEKDLKHIKYQFKRIYENKTKPNLLFIESSIDYGLQAIDANPKINYIATSNLVKPFYPEVIYTQSGKVIAFNQHNFTKDEYLVKSINDSLCLDLRFNDIFEKILLYGGHLSFAFELDETIQTMLDNAKKILFMSDKNKFWICDYEELSNWIYAYYDIIVRIENRSEVRTAIYIANESDKSIRNFSLKFYPNAPFDDIKISSENFSSRIPNISLKSDYAVLIFDEIKSGEKIALWIDLRLKDSFKDLKFSSTY